MRHLDTEALRALIAVVDGGSFTAAAEQIGRSQASVSMAVARLEKSLGISLLHRTTRRIALTEAGEVLTSYGRRIRALEDEALATILGPLGKSRVRIGMPDDYLDTLGLPLVNAFAALYPQTHVETLCDFSSRLEAMVSDGQIELAIITREADRPRGELLRSEPMVWYGALDPGAEFQRPLPLALFPEWCRARPRILATLDEAYCPWRIAYTSSHFHGVEAAVASGLAVTALAQSVAPGRLRQINPAAGLPPLPRLELAVLTHERAQLPTRRFAALVRSTVTDEATVLT